MRVIHPVGVPREELFLLSMKQPHYVTLGEGGPQESARYNTVMYLLYVCKAETKGYVCVRTLPNHTFKVLPVLNPITMGTM